MIKRNNALLTLQSRDFFYIDKKYNIFFKATKQNKIHIIFIWCDLNNTSSNIIEIGFVFYYNNRKLKGMQCMHNFCLRCNGIEIFTCICLSIKPVFMCSLNFNLISLHKHADSHVGWATKTYLAARGILCESCSRTEMYGVPKQP